MQVTRRSRILLRLQGLLFAVLFTGIIGMLAWLSNQYVYQADWTTGARNTISDDTRKLLADMGQPVNITAFIQDDDLVRRQVQDLVGSYQRFKDDIALEFINPDTAPERVRELGITGNGAVVIRYGDRSETIQILSEQQLSNALLRLSRQDERWIVFLSGHGERMPSGETNYGMGLFSQELERKGLNVQTINLAEMIIPSNTNLLVLASPRVKLLPGELDILRDYVEQGKNLLWLMEPGDMHGLETLAEQLGIMVLPGMVVDANTQMFGIENPAFVVVSGYPRHAITSEMTAVSVYPEATALEINDTGTWKAIPLLSTLQRSWTELDELEDEIAFNPGTDERAGPLDIGVVLTRPLPSGNKVEDQHETGGATPEQRIVVIGDGDFLSNTYLGNAGNLGLGLNIVHWLSHDDAFIDIQIRSAPDTLLELGKISQAMIGLGFLIGLPLTLLLTGTVIWLRRRRR
ncbi:MAG: ABC transporter [Gammaproteobacteria bacterium]|nr:ABC transporter [Gammaproteobacteria bacterium]